MNPEISRRGLFAKLNSWVGAYSSGEGFSREFISKFVFLLKFKG